VPSDASPFALVSAAAEPAVLDKVEALRLTRALESEALAAPPAGAVAALQDVRFLTPSTRRTYATLGAAGTTARVLGEGVQSWLEPGLVGEDLEPDDPLRYEWIVVLTEPVVACFAAVDRRAAEEPDMARLFEGAVTRDPEVVRSVAERLRVPFVR
jgi:DICT domain-containing protein